MVYVKNRKLCLSLLKSSIERCRLLFPDTCVKFVCSVTQNYYSSSTFLKGQNPLRQFPRSKSVTVGDFPAASPRAKVRCVVLFHRFRYNDLLATSWQLRRLRVSYGKTGVMDFVLYCPLVPAASDWLG